MDESAIDPFLKKSLVLDDSKLKVIVFTIACSDDMASNFYVLKN
jgi:hypothetical protein